MNDEQSGAHDAPDGPQLSAADVAAVDAWIDGGFDVHAVGAANRDRALRVAALLSKLSTPTGSPDRTLADVTMTRVLRAGGRSLTDAALSGEDADALDAWVLHGYDAARVPASLRERAECHEALARVVCAGSAVSATDLADRVMDRIESDEAERARRMTVPTAGGRGIGLSDLVSVAAVLMIAGSVVWPALASVRDRSRRAVCFGNLGNTGSALAMYAGSNRDALPASAGLGGGKFWDVGGETPHSNSANLYTLAREGYVPVATLACPGNPMAPTSKWDDHARDWRNLDEISYSYQLMSGPATPRWNDGARPVLADRSPVIIRLARGEPADPYANAPNHRSTGEHLLLTDGTVKWITSPVLESGDNIWIPRVLENRLNEAKRGLPAGSLSGTEAPAGVDDTFLGP